MPPANLADDAGRRPQFRLHDLVYWVLVMALVFANLTPAMRTWRDREWLAAALVFTIFGMLLSPVLLICLVIYFSPTSLAGERDTARFVVKTTLVIELLLMAMVIYSQ